MVIPPDESCIRAPDGVLTPGVSGREDVPAGPVEPGIVELLPGGVAPVLGPGEIGPGRVGPGMVGPGEMGPGAVEPGRGGVGPGFGEPGVLVPPPGVPTCPAAGPIVTPTRRQPVPIASSVRVGMIEAPFPGMVKCKASATPSPGHTEED